jgi:hypothetical protein
VGARAAHGPVCDGTGGGVAMQTAILRHTVERDQLEHHLELLHAVYAELQSSSAGDFRFATFQVADDETSFVEFVVADRLPGPLPQLDSFRRYRAGLDDRCERRSFTELTPVGAFRFPG